MFVNLGLRKQTQCEPANIKVCTSVYDHAYLLNRDYVFWGIQSKAPHKNPRTKAVEP